MTQLKPISGKTVAILFCSSVLSLAISGSASAYQTPTYSIEPVAPKTSDQIAKPQDFKTQMDTLIANHQYNQAADMLMAHEGSYKPFVLDLMNRREDAVALAILQSALTQNPQDGWSRFQMAEIQFKVKRDGAALIDYRLALSSSDLDDTMIETAKVHMAAITARRAGSVSLSGSLAPDKDVGADLKASQIDAYSLPVTTQNEDDLKRSGRGITGQYSLSKIFNNGGTLGFLVNLSSSGTFYPAHMLGFGSFAARFGPQIRYGADSTFAIEADSKLIWFDGHALEHVNGIYLENSIYAHNIQWDTQLTLDHINSPEYTILDGSSYQLDVTRTRYFGASSLWNLKASLAIRDAHAIYQAYRTYKGAVGRLYQGPFKSFIYVEGTLSYRPYEGVSPDFPNTIRADTYMSLMARVTRQDFEIFRAIPFISLTAENNASSLSAFSYNGLRFNAGLTRSF